MDHLQRLTTLLLLAAAYGCTFSEPEALADASGEISDEGGTEGGIEGSSEGAPGEGTEATAPMSGESGESGDAESGSEAAGSESTGEASQLLARWTFDGDAADVGPEGLDAALDGRPQWGTDGEATGLLLDGVDDVVDLSAAAPAVVDSLAALTIRLRIRVDVYGPASTALWFLGGAEPLEAIESNAHGLRVRGGRLELFTEHGAGGIDDLTDLGPAPSEGVLHELVVTFDDGMATCWLDDVFHAKAPYVPAETTTGEMVLGGWWTTEQLVTGFVDDFAIFRGVLDPADLDD